MRYEAQELSPDLWRAYQELFESDKTTAQCWCINHRVSLQNLVLNDEAKTLMKSWICPIQKLRLVKATEAAVSTREPQTVHGVLLFENESPIGWLGVEPLQALVGHDLYEEEKFALQDSDPLSRTWAIHCLFLLKPYRGKGLTHLLIKKALDLAQKKGAERVYAYPTPRERESKMNDSQKFAGRLDAYLACGFQIDRKVSESYQRVSYEYS